MITEIYESLGLSPNEAKIYESLIGTGESGISAISVNAKIHRRNAYDAIHRLIDKGLVFEIFSSGENKYNAVDPDKLTELLSEKQVNLQKILPELKHKFKHRLAPEEAYIYRGFEGQKNIWRDIIRVGGEVCNIGAKAQWFDERLNSSRKLFFEEVNKRKIKVNLLFDQEVKTKLPSFAKNYPAKLFDYRYLPKEYSTNSIANIYGDYVVTYTGITVGKMENDTVFFVLHSKGLAESYRKWFWFMWNLSKKS